MENPGKSEIFITPQKSFHQQKNPCSNEIFSNSPVKNFEVFGKKIKKIFSNGPWYDMNLNIFKLLTPCEKKEISHSGFVGKKFSKK